MTKKKMPAPLSPMAQFVADVQASPALAIQLMLWKERHRNADMTVVITDMDVQGFRACTEYLEVVPTIKFFQPGGLPARAAVTVREGKQLPARAAVPPRDECVVQLVDKNGNAITPIENSQEEQAKGRQAQQIRGAREKAAQLVGEVRNMMAMGTTSSSLIDELCNSVLLLARS